VALNYHNVDPAVFERHAAWLARTARVLPLAEFLHDAPSDDARPTVALTFDDGYAGFVEDIVPILERHALTAAWFVPTAYVDRDDVLWFDRVTAALAHDPRRSFEFAGRHFTLRGWDVEYVTTEVKAVLKSAPRERLDGLLAELLVALPQPSAAELAPFRLVSRAQLAALDPGVVTLGSHSHTHPQLSALDEFAIRDEIVHSRRLLEEWTGRPVVDFAYPSGDHDGRVVRLLEETGWRSAWTTRPGFVDSLAEPLRLPRVAVDDVASVANLAAKMTPLVHRAGVLG
jgi:peptidoglycan/xylan/chitin deacetylase (PgdA/CDA1 family)